MLSEERKARQRDYMRKRRLEAKESGVKLKSDNWAADNKEKHKDKTRKWRELNPERSSEITKASQKTRRSTPWGIINNRMWPSVHSGVKRNASTFEKYNKVLAYTWATLRLHLESMFDESMTWDNWGKYWELDHIKPISSFKYKSIEDEEFLMCWSLSNLRPLRKDLNQSKGAN